MAHRSLDDVGFVASAARRRLRRRLRSSTASIAPTHHAWTRQLLAPQTPLLGALTHVRSGGCLPPPRLGGVPSSRSCSSPRANPKARREFLFFNATRAQATNRWVSSCWAGWAACVRVDTNEREGKSAPHTSRQIVNGRRNAYYFPRQ